MGLCVFVCKSMRVDQIEYIYIYIEEAENKRQVECCLFDVDVVFCVRCDVAVLWTLYKPFRRCKWNRDRCDVYIADGAIVYADDGYT